MDGVCEGQSRFDRADGRLDGPDAPELDVDALVALVLLLDVLEAEVERLGLPELAWARELLGKRQELVVVVAVVEPEKTSRMGMIQRRRGEGSKAAGKARDGVRTSLRWTGR